MAATAAASVVPILHYYHPALEAIPAQARRCVENDDTVQHILETLDALVNVGLQGTHLDPRTLDMCLREAWLQRISPNCARLSEPVHTSYAGVLNEEAAAAIISTDPMASTLRGEEDHLFESEFWTLVLASKPADRAAHLEEHVEVHLDVTPDGSRLTAFALRGYNLDPDLPTPAEQQYAIKERNEREQKRRRLTATKVRNTVDD